MPQQGIRVLVPTVLAPPSAPTTILANASNRSGPIATTASMPAGALGIIVCVAWANPADYPISAVDSAGNSYTVAARTTTGTNAYNGGILYCSNVLGLPAGGTVTVTTNLSSQVSIGAYYVTGANGGLDGTAATVNNSQTNSLVIGPTAALGSDNEIALGISVFTNGDGSGYNFDGFTTQDGYFRYKLLSSAAALTWTETWSGNADWTAGSLATFKAGAAAGTTTLDPAHTHANITLSNGNLTATGSGGADANTRSVNSYSSGKFYCEFTSASSGTDHTAFGIMSTSDSTSVNIGGPDNKSVGFYNNDVNIYINNASAGTMGGGYNSGDIVGMAVDFGNNAIWFRINGGNWNNSGTANPATNTGGISISGISASAPFCTAVYAFSAGQGGTVNFGGSAYSYAVPSGFGNW